jgi:hypothetical protein
MVHTCNVTTLTLGLRPRQGGYKVTGQRGGPKSHLTCSRDVQRVERVWGNEPSHSQMNSHCGSWSHKCTPEFLERNCNGQNPSVWIVLYIIGKLLKLKCLKWVCVTHLDIYNKSYDQKKGRGSNWQFDSQPVKVGNSPNFLMFRWHATCRWKGLNEGYNFVIELITIGGLHTKLWGPKVVGILVMRILGIPLGSPKTKCHLDLAPMERHIEYYNGEGGGFPQNWAVVSLVSPRLLVARPSTKSAQTMH